MQLDPGFAARLRARDARAERSTELGAEELAWLRAADPAAVSADREGRRRAQHLRNAAGEFALTLAVAADPGWLESFPGSDHFHRAIASDAPLPLALADHLRELAARGPAPLRSLLELESALARARREPHRVSPTGSFAWIRSPSTWLIELREGTFDWASALRQMLDGGDIPAGPPATGSGSGTETVLIHALASLRGSQLREVRAERLEPLVAEFLHRGSQGIDEQRIGEFCRARGLARADVETVIAEFAAEGVLVRPLSP
jgi:hypothetical protein